MKNSKLRQVLTGMIAIREMRLGGLARVPVPEAQVPFVMGERAALKEALERLGLFEQARLDNAVEKIRLDWADEVET